MKLHLPVTLFTALMAVMVTLPASAKVTFTNDENIELQDDTLKVRDYHNVTLIIEDDPDDVGDITGVKTEGKTNMRFFGSNSITIGKGCFLEITKGPSFLAFSGSDSSIGETTIELNGELRWNGADTNKTTCDLFYAVGTTTGTTTTGTINVRDGGVLNCDDLKGGIYAPCLSKVYDAGATMITNINVFKGGTVYAKRMTVGEVNSRGSKCVTNLNLCGGIYDAVRDGAGNERGMDDVIGKGLDLETTITITDGGKYLGSDNSEIGDTSSSNSKMVLRIDVAGEESLFSTSGKIADYGQNGTTSKVDITVRDGAKFLIKQGGSTASIGDVTANGRFELNIQVIDAQFCIENSVNVGDSYIPSGGTEDVTMTIEGNSTLSVDWKKGLKGYIYGNVILKGGRLEFKNNAAGSSYQKDFFAKGVQVRTDSSKSPITIDVGGLDASLIKGISLSNGGDQIIGLMKDTTLTLHEGDVIKVSEQNAVIKVSEQNAVVGGEGALEGKQVILQFGTDAGDAGDQSIVDVADGIQIKLDLDGKQVAAQESDVGVTLEVWLTNGRLKGEDSEDSETWAKEHFILGTGWGLSVKSWNAEEGKLILSGRSNIWDADVDGPYVKAEKLSEFDKVVIDEQTTVTAEEGTDGVIRQLEGSSDLTIRGSGTVEFENKNEGSAFVSTGDTILSGNIVAEDGVNLKKTGDASLTVDGDLKAGGDVTVEEGKLAIGGNDSSIDGKLTLDGEGALQVNGKLTLNGKDNDLTSASSDQLTGDGSIFVGDGGSLKLSSDVLTDENGLSFGATKGGRLEFTGDTPVDLKKLAEGTTGTVKGAEFTSTGDATFAGSVEGKLTVKGGSLNMSNAANSSCDLVVQGEDTQVTITPGSEYNSITVGDDVQNNDKLIVTAAAEGNKAGADIRVTGDIVFRNGAEADFTINLSDPNLWGSDDHDATMLSTGRTIYIEPGTKFVVDCLANTLLNAKGNLSKVILLQGGEVKNMEYRDDEEAMISGIMLTSLEPASEDEKQLNNVKFDLGVILSQLYEDPSLWTDGKKVWFDAARRSASPWTPVATSRNSGAGLNLLWQHINTAGAAIDPQVENMFTVLDNLVAVNPAEARRVMAAIPGSTLTSLSAAQSAALRNQMGRVRDHALQAGRLRCMGNDEATATQRPCKNSHVWVEGTSFFSEQHSVGDESGYRLNSWGGAVGIDAQVDAHWSVGVSLSASYGDLEARAADYAKGDLDTYTVSFWSQAKNGRWGNTLLFTLGTNEADLKRTVNYGAGSYTATSNTSGSSLGAMWEVTYDFHPVKENKSNILQPLFNVAMMHTSMDGFSEKNAGNVGLAAEKQTRDTVTLGLGLRWLAAINSAKAVNRTVSTEVHANVAQDLGDRRSVANVALLADPNFTQSVYGSKTGSTAFQFGAGVNVPVTPNSQIYVNAGGELREHANAWNAALGVRMGF